MANKILRFNSTLPTVQTTAPTYLDVSLVAQDAYGIGWEMGIQPVYLSDYFAFIGTEQTLSGIMTEDSYINPTDLSDVVTSDEYITYVNEAENLSPVVKYELLTVLAKLSSNDDDSSCLEPAELRLLVNNYDVDYFGVNLPDPLKVIAIELRKGYAEANRRYQMYLERSKYHVGSDKDVEAVQNSLDNIFSWTQGERILFPEFGTRLREYLYNGITDENTEQIINEIKNAIITWEPRVKLETIANMTTTDDIENNQIHLEIIYSIPALSNKQYNYSYVQSTV